jgi:hypothetical protein
LSVHLGRLEFRFVLKVPTPTVFPVQRSDRASTLSVLQVLPYFRPMWLLKGQLWELYLSKC